MEKRENIIDWKLISKRLKDNLSPEEEIYFERWLNSSLEHRNFFKKVQVNDVTDPDIGICEELLEIKKMELISRISKSNKSKKVIRIIFRYAAILLIPLSLTIAFLWVSSIKNVVPDISESIIPRGESKAILIMNSGKKIYIDSLPQLLTENDGSQIKANESKLVYSKNISEEVIFNELVVPRGGEYQLQLADGTRVWLNSATKLRFPVAFNGEKREVYLDGEAFFEVSKDSIRPFRVYCKDIRIQVYGTQFNINSINKSKIKTTLVEGSIGVKVLKSGIEKKLKPNQLAEFISVDKSLLIRDVDVSKYVAWRYGEFVFEEERIEDIMNRLALWYNVEVFFKNDDVKDFRFTGSMKRYNKIGNLLHYIEETGGVHFDVNKRTVIVNKK